MAGRSTFGWVLSVVALVAFATACSGSASDPPDADSPQPDAPVIQGVQTFEGLSNRQVAQTMGRHEKTVECHVTEILRRLEARNMIDAIRIATRLKLIL